MPRRENARDRILEAAESLVVEKGVDALTMDTIAMMTGLGKGGVLYHFNYKVDLLAGLIDRFLGNMEIMQEGMPDPGADVYAWLDHSIELALRRRGEMHRGTVAVFAAASRYPQLMKPVREFYEARQRKILNHVSDPQLAAILALAIDGYGVLGGMAIPPISDDEVDSVRERMLEIVDVMRKADKKTE